MGKGRQPGCCLYKPEGAVVKEIFDTVHLVVDNTVLLLFMFTYCHIILSCIG